MRIAAPALHDHIVAILRGAGSEADEAETVAAHLVESNLRGHDSHGVGTIPAYIRNIGLGRLHPNRHAVFGRQDGVFVTVDGGMGYGQVIAREATARAIEVARAQGLALLALRNVHHIGRVGTYGEQAVNAGLVSISFVNGLSGAPRVAPFRGRDPRMATNPICIAVPNGDTPVVLDFATSRIALNKVRVALNEGRQVAPGSLITAEGTPSTDPRIMYWDQPRGALLPFGEHKGSGLGLICELLGGVLTGGATAQHADADDLAIVNGMLSILIDPARLVDLPWFAQEVAGVVAHVKASPPAEPDAPVLVAGDPERLMRAERLADGIPIDPTTWRAITDAAASVGVAVAA